MTHVIKASSQMLLRHVPSMSMLRKGKERSEVHLLCPAAINNPLTPVSPINGCPSPAVTFGR